MPLKIHLLFFFVGALTISTSAEKAMTPRAEETATVPAKDHSDVPTLELMTTDSILSSSDIDENSTDPALLETPEGGLEAAALVGIIIGILAAIGVAIGIVVIVIKKMP